MYTESEKILWRWTCLEYDARYGVRKFEEAGGSYFWKAVREKGGSDEPLNPPLVTGLHSTTNKEALCVAIRQLEYFDCQGRP